MSGPDPGFGEVLSVGLWGTDAPRSAERIGLTEGPFRLATLYIDKRQQELKGKIP